MISQDTLKYYDKSNKERGVNCKTTTYKEFPKTERKGVSCFVNILTEMWPIIAFENIRGGEKWRKEYRNWQEPKLLQEYDQKVYKIT